MRVLLSILFLGLALFSCQSNKHLSTSYGPNDIKGIIVQVGSMDIRPGLESGCTGIIVDQELQEVIPFVTVRLRNKNYEVNTSSDSTGHFEIMKVPGGLYEIKLDFVGYYPFRDTIHLENGKKRNYRIGLVMDPDFKL